MDHCDVFEDVPDGWLFVRRNQSKSESSYFYCPATNQRFNTYKDLMRYVNYARKEKLSIYGSDFCSFKSEIKADPRDMHNPNHSQGVTKPTALSQDFYASTSEVEVDARDTHELAHGQSVTKTTVAPILEDYRPIFQPNAINEVANQEIRAFNWKDLANYNLADLGADLECDLSLNPHQIDFGCTLSGCEGNRQNQPKRSPKIICYQRRNKRTKSIR